MCLVVIHLIQIKVLSDVFLDKAKPVQPERKEKKNTLDLRAEVNALSLKHFDQAKRTHKYKVTQTQDND